MQRKLAIGFALLLTVAAALFRGVQLSIMAGGKLVVVTPSLPARTKSAPEASGATALRITPR